jgi:hypothetical protein
MIAVNRAEKIEAFNHILAIYGRSLPLYLDYAQPWQGRETKPAIETLHQIAANERGMAERIGEAIVDAGYLPDRGEFPMAFTGWHDLAAAFLVDKAIERQRHDLRELEQYAKSLPGEPLVQEAFGMAQGHLDALEEAAGKLQASAQSAGV